MTVIVNDAFTGTNGTLPANWSLFGGGTGVINSNKFRLTGASSPTYGSVRATRSTPTANDDLDLYVTLDLATAYTGSQWSYLYLHCSGSWTQLSNGGIVPTQGYALSLAWGNSTPDVTILRYVNSAYSSIASTANGQLNLTGPVRVRFQAFRSTGIIRYKCWPVAQTEPTTWQATYTDSAPLTAGKVALGSTNGFDTTLRPMDFDDLTVDDNAVTAPAPVVQPSSTRVVDKWNGTTLVRQRTDRWDGSALIQRTIEGFQVWDAFSRTSAVSAGSTPTGQVWIPATGSTWGTDGDRLYNVTSTDGAFISADVGKPDQDLTVTLAQGALIANAFPEIIMSNDDAQTPFGYWIECQGNSGSMRVVQPFSSFDHVVAGVFTSTAAQTIRVKVEQITSPAPANRVTVWVNGTQKFTADHTDPARPTGTRIGFRHGQLNTATVQKWDNLSVR